MSRRIRALLCVLALAMALPAAASAATFNVTTDSDSSGGACLPASCTLRQAVEAVNAGGGGDTINVPAGLYTLTSGELQLQKSVTIDGAGPTATVVEGDGLSRVFNVTGAAVVASIESLAVENGRVAGNGSPQAHGGGILNAGTLSLGNVLVRGNAVVPASSSGLVPAGGGIFNSGTLHVVNTTITGNHANTLPEGGVPSGAGLANENGQVDLTDSTLSGNVTSANGAVPQAGGLHSLGATVHGAKVTLTRVLLEGNRAINTSAVGGVPQAGGIYASGTDLTIVDSTVRGNRAVGGAIADAGGLLVFSAGNFTLERSLVAGNIAESSVFAYGAGLYLDDEATDVQKIVDSTITANRATAPTGINGGGIYHSGARLDILSSTISGNVASGGASDHGGNLLDSGSSGSVLSLRDSIVSAGAGTSGAENCSGAGVQSAGHDIDSLDQCNFHAAGDEVKTDPLLAALADNGGPTETLALNAGSPAIGAGDAACPATDQRGVARPQGAACDIGAFELVPPVGEAKLQLLSRTVTINLKPGRVRMGRGTARAKCLNVASDECRATLTLLARLALGKAGKGKRLVRLGTATGTIAGGATGRLSIKLNRKGISLLKRQRGHKLRAMLSGSSRNRAGQATSFSGRLTLKGKSPKRR